MTCIGRPGEDMSSSDRGLQSRSFAVRGSSLHRHKVDSLDVNNHSQAAHAASKRHAKLSSLLIAQSRMQFECRKPEHLLQSRLQQCTLLCQQSEILAIRKSDLMRRDASGSGIGSTDVWSLACCDGMPKIINANLRSCARSPSHAADLPMLPTGHTLPHKSGETLASGIHSSPHNKLVSRGSMLCVRTGSSLHGDSGRSGLMLETQAAEILAPMIRHLCETC